MNLQRRYVKIERTPEDQSRIDAIRERFQRDRPSLEELVDSGEFEPPISAGDYWDMVEMVVALRAAREAAGLDQNAVAARIGIDPEMLGRLESGKDDPTIALLRRYAAALGKQIVLTLSDVPNPPSANFVQD
jgi:DNA-binding XRE family transcriptional regulator